MLSPVTARKPDGKKVFGFPRVVSTYASSVIVAGCLVQRHKTKLLNDVPGVDRLVGVFDYRPTLYPQAWSIDAIIAQVLPLPLVPATWTERN